MKDRELEAYCAQIESTFFRFKGRPGTLSPPDFALTEAWFRAGMPLEAVLDGIAEAFASHASGRERGATEVNSLRFCESFVDRVADRRRSF